MKRKMVDRFKYATKFGIREETLRALVEQGIRGGLEKFRGVPPYTEEEREAVRIMGHGGEQSKLEDVVEWYTHGYIHAHLYALFLRTLFEENDLVVGVGRDSIPLLAGIHLLRDKEPRTAYIGISHGVRNLEYLLHKLNQIAREGLIDNVKIEGNTVVIQQEGRRKVIGTLPRHLIKRLENLAKIARKEKRTVVFLDNGKRGTHILPLKILMKKLFPYVKVETAIFQVIKDWKDYHDRVWYIAERDSGTDKLRKLPHPVGAYVEVDRAASPLFKEFSTTMWKAYITGFRDGMERLRRLIPGKEPKNKNEKNS